MYRYVFNNFRIFSCMFLYFRVYLIIVKILLNLLIIILIIDININLLLIKTSNTKYL